jgi:hypothetical protein
MANTSRLDLPRSGETSPIDRTVPYGTDHVGDAFPGNKLPGYHHAVPPGPVGLRREAATQNSRFAAQSETSLGMKISRYKLNLFRKAWVARREISTSSPPLRVSFSV